MTALGNLSVSEYVFQVELMKVMFRLEDAFYAVAKATGSKSDWTVLKYWHFIFCVWLRASSGKKSIIICDRGAMDASAYIDSESWKVWNGS